MSGVARIFVYGTLMRGGTRPQAQRFQQEAEFMETGTLPGKLYHIGQYPGAMYDTANRKDKIHGEIWRMYDPAKTLAWLDAYEGCSPADREPHEYLRRILPVSPETDYHLACHVYLYNWFVDGKAVVAEGKWVT